MVLMPQSVSSPKQDFLHFRTTEYFPVAQAWWWVTRSHKGNCVLWSRAFLSCLPDLGRGKALYRLSLPWNQELGQNADFVLRAVSSQDSSTEQPLAELPNRDQGPKTPRVLSSNAASFSTVLWKGDWEAPHKMMWVHGDEQTLVKNMVWPFCLRALITWGHR